MNNKELAEWCQQKAVSINEDAQFFVIPELKEQADNLHQCAEALRKASQASAELKKHLTSTVEYDLVDGIRQLAQQALTWKGNFEDLERKASQEHERLQEQLFAEKASNVMEQSQARDAALREVLR